MKTNQFLVRIPEVKAEVPNFKKMIPLELLATLSTTLTTKAEVNAFINHCLSFTWQAGQYAVVQALSTRQWMLYSTNASSAEEACMRIARDTGNGGSTVTPYCVLGNCVDTTCGGLGAVAQNNFVVNGPGKYIYVLPT